jgi:hypothetical protein
MIPKLNNSIAININDSEMGEIPDKELKRNKEMKIHE